MENTKPHITHPVIQITAKHRQLLSQCFDDHLRIEEGACGLEGELECAEFEGQLVALSVLEEAALELGGVLEDVAIEGVEQEHLVCGDDAADLLEVDDDGALAAQDRGWVHEERVEQAEVPGRELAAPHHGGLVDLQRLHGGRGGLDADPAARAVAALLQVGDVQPRRRVIGRWSGRWGLFTDGPERSRVARSGTAGGESAPGEAAAGLERGGGGDEGRRRRWRRASVERERARSGGSGDFGPLGSGGRRGILGNAVAISEKRGRARDFSNVAGDRRPRKHVRDQAQIAARLCGIICLLDSEAEQTRYQTGPMASAKQNREARAPSFTNSGKDILIWLSPMSNEILD